MASAATAYGDFYKKNSNTPGTRISLTFGGSGDAENDNEDAVPGDSEEDAITKKARKKALQRRLAAMKTRNV